MLIGLLIASIAFDVLLSVRFFWNFRIVTIILSASLSLVATSIAMVYLGMIGALVLLLLILFRFIVFARVILNRLHKQHLLTSTKRSLLWLNSSIILFIGIQLTIDGIALSFIEAAALLQLSFAFAICAFVANSIIQTKYHSHHQYLSDKELPTVTVAIPARNETDDLRECIETVLSSDYPKLEVLVLDDCSQGKKPADVIKQQAHAGVRFLQGTPPSDNWLAKNHAYQQLTDEATGSYIVFCGVDVRMSPSYLRNLITHMKHKKKRMMSVLPVRYQSHILSSFIQPMRYWWELALPRKLINRPAVLSTCWVIQKKVLKQLGSFHAVKKSIVPERYFARECVAHDSYSFIRANEHLDLRTLKQPEDQVHTAYRVRYPQFHSRIELVLLYIAFLGFFLIIPYALTLSAFIVSNTTLLVLSSLTIGLLTFSHLMIMTISHPANNLVAFFNLPFVVLSEMTLTIYSMLQYEFGSVTWKGRNICIPVLTEQQDN